MIASRLLLLSAALVRGARFAHALALRDLRHGDFPPPAALLRGAIRIGLDAHDVSLVRSTRALQRLLELGDRLHILGLRAQRSRVGREVDLRRSALALHAVGEEVVERSAAAGLLQAVDA